MFSEAKARRVTGFIECLKHTKGEINALWTAIRELQKKVIPPEPDDEWPEFVQPTGAGTAYQVGDKVTSRGERYICVQAHCVWSPADYPAGWEKQP